MIYCRYCGTMLEDAAQFCPACGNPVVRPAEPRAEKEPTRCLRPWPFIALGCVALSVLSAFLKIGWLWPQLAIAGFVFGIIGCRRRYRHNWAGIVSIPLAVLALLFGLIYNMAFRFSSSLPDGYSYGFEFGPEGGQWDQDDDFYGYDYGYGDSGDSEEKWV